MLKNILYSTFWNKCPKCHSRDVFPNAMYDLKKFDVMNKSCDCCGEVYEKETGFFYGAMYVSYALMVAWFVITWAIDSFFIHSETWQYLTFVITTMILLIPASFRLSRLLWLNFFIRYDEESCIHGAVKTKIDSL